MLARTIRLDNTRQTRTLFILFLAALALLATRPKTIFATSDWDATYWNNTTLSGNPAGKAFIDFYYRYSPSLAKRILRNSHLKDMVRIGLLPVVSLSWAALKNGPLTTAAAILFLIAGIIAVARFKRN